jgi:tRNA nucleotidyltransferase (CCA-adding enzyme)
MIRLVLEAIEKAGGNYYLVGGFVRDKLLGLEPKDIDVEVFGLSYDSLVLVLEKFGKTDIVGKSFGVIKVKIGEDDYDFNLPRRDSKNGVGHKGFNVSVDHTMTIEEAAARRDFTINSMSIDSKGNLIDPFKGQVDLVKGILRPTSEAFRDDVLRAIRGFQFSARFNMSASDSSIDMIKDMSKEYHTLPKERIFEEWKKWGTKGKYYSQSLKYLSDIGWLYLYPELEAIYGVEQDVIHHPEGPVEIHTGHVLDYMAELCERENITGDDRLVLIFAALCHDFGKAVCSFKEYSPKYGREVIKAHGHEAESVPLARSFLESIGCPEDIIKVVLPLVKLHMVHEKMKDKTLRKLSNKLYPATMRQLFYLCESDQSGRPPLPRGISENLRINIDNSIRLGILDGRPAKIVTGKDLIKAGYTPGPNMGKLLDKLYELQLRGSFYSVEVGLKVARSLIKLDGEYVCN